MVLALFLIGTGQASAQTREYWIAAVDTQWDVAPNGMDPVMGTMIPPAQRKFVAVVYRRFTPGFRRPWPNTSTSGDNDGIPGPTIRAEVGDTVLVHFENRDHHYGLRRGETIIVISSSGKNASAGFPSNRPMCSKSTRPFSLNVTSSASFAPPACVTGTRE